MLIRAVYKMLVVCCLASAVGCSSIPQPVTTVWQQLGFPQAMERIIDRTANRSGNRPQLERKPKIKRLVDPANLKADAPKALQAAAKIKQAEDLAPQKIKALKYLGQVGCGCYNKQNADMVEGAILEALNDCTPSVRSAALQAIASSAGNCCVCTDDQCNGSACCTDKILKKVEEMAYKQDKNGCFIEPDESVRNMAAGTLSACPPRPPSEVEEKALEEVTNRMNPYPYPATHHYPSPEYYAEALDRSATELAASRRAPSKYIESTVFDVATESKTLSVLFSKPYKIPVGSEAVIYSDASEIACKVVESQEGSVLLEATQLEGDLGLNSDDRIQLGILQSP